MYKVMVVIDGTFEREEHYQCDDINEALTQIQSFKTEDAKENQKHDYEIWPS